MASISRKQVRRCLLLETIAREKGLADPRPPIFCIPENSPICLSCPHCPADRTQLGRPPGKHAVAPISEPTARVGVLPTTGEASPQRVRQRHPPTAVPPKQVTITLCEQDLIDGRLRMTPGLSEMARFYGWRGGVYLVTYGEYHLQGWLDGSLDAIVGPEIAEWFRENGLQAGDKVHLEAPSAKGDWPRIFTLHDKGRPPEDEQPAARRRRLWLRHRIYVALAEAGIYLHPQVLAEKVAERDGLEVETSQVQAALVGNSHVFARFADNSNLWGLTEWVGVKSRPSVDPISLLLAIGEEDLVHQVLRSARQPLSSTEIAARIADHFALPVSEIEHLTPVNAADSRLVRLRDGRWGLRSWISEWGREREKLHEQLQAREELGSRLDRLRREEQVLQEVIVARSRRGLRHWLRRVWEGLVRLLARCLKPFSQRGQGRPTQAAAMPEEQLGAVRAEIAALEANLAAAEDEVCVRTRLRQLHEWLSLVPTPEEGALG